MKFDFLFGNLFILQNGEFYLLILIGTLTYSFDLFEKYLFDWQKIDILSCHYSCHYQLFRSKLRPFPLKYYQYKRMNTYYSESIDLERYSSVF